MKRAWSWLNPVLALITAAALSYYAVALHWSVFEIPRCLLGLFLLWSPLAVLLYVCLSRTLRDPTVRLAVGFAASYVVTTLLYFGLAVLRMPWLFAPVLLAAAAWAVWIAYRAGKGSVPEWPRPDWILLAIIAGSLVTIIPYSTVFKTDRSGSHVLIAFPDQLYHAGLEYELSRHVPPLQASILGGSPERAYHMFSQLTVVLISRFTGQGDMLRAHSVYHYAAITVLICAALYGIGLLLTHDRRVGYVCAFLPFLFAIATPPIGKPEFDYLFLTELPHATSSVFPTLFTSPQMFSGIACTYGLMLLVAATLRIDEWDRGANLLVVFSGLITGALLRFRVHCWLAVLPIFLLYAGFMWYRSRRVVWIVSAAIAVGVSALLYAEMQSPVYMRGTSALHIGLNALSSIPRYSSWPLSPHVLALLQHVFSGSALAWTWQVICLSQYAVWNIIGIPVLFAFVLVVFLRRCSAVLAFGLFSAGIMLASLVGSMCLSMDYDQYSVSGQLLFHLGWYALPVAGIGAAWLVNALRKRIPRAPVLFLLAAIGSGLASMITQREIIPYLTTPKGVITASGWQALQYLKEHTPETAIVLSSNGWDRVIYVVSGLGARAGYSDGNAGNPVATQALTLNPADDRSARLQEMGAARNPAQLCSILTGTPITHILEESSARLMPGLTCLQPVWTGSDGMTRVWKVLKPNGTR